MDLAAGEHPGEHALVGHDALAGLLLDDTVVVALFAEDVYKRQALRVGKFPCVNTIWNALR